MRKPSWQSARGKAWMATGSLPYHATPPTHRTMHFPHHGHPTLHTPHTPQAPHPMPCTPHTPPNLHVTPCSTDWWFSSLFRTSQQNVGNDRLYGLENEVALAKTLQHFLSYLGLLSQATTSSVHTRVEQETLSAKVMLIASCCGLGGLSLACLALSKCRCLSGSKCSGSLTFLFIPGSGQYRKWLGCVQGGSRL
jgi:hypothetical protein